MSKDKTLLLGRVETPTKLDLTGLSWQNPMYRRARYSQSEIVVSKFDDDPGAAYFHFKLMDGTDAMLRGVYDEKVARDIPSAEKPAVAVYEFSVNTDTATIMIGNYNMTGKAIVAMDENTHTIIDDIMLLMSRSPYVKTWHDKDGYVTLIKREFYYKRNKKFKSHFSIDPTEPYGGDVCVRCVGISKDDDDLVHIINTALTCSYVRANVEYRNFHPTVGRKYTDAVSAAQLMSQSAMITLMDAMRKKTKFSSIAIGEFIGNFADRYASMNSRAAVTHYCPEYYGEL